MEVLLFEVDAVEGISGFIDDFCFLPRRGNHIFRVFSRLKQKRKNIRAPCKRH